MPLQLPCQKPPSPLLKASPICSTLLLPDFRNTWLEGESIHCFSAAMIQAKEGLLLGVQGEGLERVVLSCLGRSFG